MEKRANNKIFVVALIILAVSFLFYSGDAFLEGGMMHDTGWIHGNYWRWFPSALSLIIGVLIGWLIFRRRT